MDARKAEFQTIDEYIDMFSGELKTKLQTLRRTISETAPEAQETISYRMPTFKLDGNLVHFAVMKNHIGFYPTSSGVRNFQEKLTAFKTTKGAIQFPIDKPLPLPLVRKIVRFRVKENKQRAKARATKSR
jgi:uncharacterized protein YdhG (YjbR/CyaY superfamily)